MCLTVVSTEAKDQKDRNNLESIISGSLLRRVTAAHNQCCLLSLNKCAAVSCSIIGTVKKINQNRRDQNAQVPISLCLFFFC